MSTPAEDAVATCLRMTGILLPPEGAARWMVVHALAVELLTVDARARRAFAIGERTIDAVRNGQPATEADRAVVERASDEIKSAAAAVDAVLAKIQAAGLRGTRDTSN